MRIIWITPECPYPPNTGGRVAIWKRIEYLALKNEIHLYTIIESEEEKKYKSIMESVCSSVHFYKRTSIMKSLLFSVKFPYPAASRWNSSLKKDLEEIYNKKNIDYIIVDFPQMLGCLPKNIINSDKIILHQHNIEYMTMRDIAQLFKNPLKRIIYKFVAKQLKRYEKSIYEKDFIRLYTFVSESDKKFFEEKFHKTNTLLVPIGAEIKKSKIMPYCHNLLFVGKMSYKPNEEGVMWIMEKILPRIKTVVPDVNLLIVGKSPSKMVIDKASELGNVIVTGLVPNLAKYYEASNIAIVPIMNGGGVNVKLLEALGCGKITITTSKGTEGTSLIGGIHLLEADEEERFTEYCIDALVNPQNYEKMLNQSYEYMNNEYSWEVIIQRFENKLEEISSRGK